MDKQAARQQDNLPNSSKPSTKALPSSLLPAAISEFSATTKKLSKEQTVEEPALPAAPPLAPQPSLKVAGSYAAAIGQANNDALPAPSSIKDGQFRQRATAKKQDVSPLSLTIDTPTSLDVAVDEEPPDPRAQPKKQKTAPASPAAGRGRKRAQKRRGRP